ncbi:MAG: V-type ATP synthase subunit F [Candidatus Thermoplasmatota archaeon]|nr:V-type ATP synthase subunit F [Candidatus Thermoplasmatota archaeon]MBS3790660.1 V-type ATP synthase subunit F [Candidatus Thermoplasmatota archaeon]
MKKNVVVVGKKDMTLGFSLVGIDETFTPTDEYESKKRINKLLEAPDVGVILLSESIAEDIREHIQKKERERKGTIYPIIVEIPDKKGPIEDKEDPLKGKIKRAVGIDITSQEGKE